MDDSEIITPQLRKEKTFANARDSLILARAATYLKLYRDITNISLLDI
jgi:hypothetical protein